jgi:serine protease Do/2-alkenal reductase
MRVIVSLLCGALFCWGAAARAADLPPAFADLAARVMPAVVSVASTDPVPAGATPGNAQGGGDDEGDGSAYHPSADTTGGVLPPPKAVEALGSGFVFDPAGYILTNNHVVNGAASVTVTFPDGTILPAIIVGRDTHGDLAVLKVQAGHPLPFVRFGDSSKLRVGDWVMAIGNPFGLPGSTSAGIVSALHRNINENGYDDFIQTDAPINSGNSGGPLFDVNGNVVGVNTAIYSPSGGSIGIGFSIPAAMAEPVAQALKTNGAMIRGWLGVATQEVTPEIQQMLGLPGTDGALVGSVAPGSPAAAALRPGDVITALAGVAVKTPRDLFIRTAEVPAGQRASASFWRDGAERQASLLIAVPPAAPPDVAAAAPAAPAGPGNLALAGLGLAVSAKPADGGVSVTSVTAGGPSAQAGIVAGDLIEQVAGVAVATAGDLQGQVKQLVAAKLPVAVLLVSGDGPDGNDPGPRWVPVTVKK